jgi:hypothetical protein
MKTKELVVAGDHVAETDVDATTAEVVTATFTFPDGATPAVNGAGASSDGRTGVGGRDALSPLWPPARRLMPGWSWSWDWNSN